MQDNPLRRYTLLREVGAGTVGRVFEVRDADTGAVLALKTLSPALLSEGDAHLAELFVKNARAAARLRHPNVVQTVDAGEAGGTAYVAMEMVEGENLRATLDRGPLPVARATQIFEDIAAALAYAHEERVVHRGVRPSSILVSTSGAAKIGEFGIGQIGAAALRYMSPEQVRGARVDARSDLFSLGAVLYEMLTGRPAFDGASPAEIRERILHAEPPPPSTLNPEVPRELDAIVARLLAKDPAARLAPFIKESEPQPELRKESRATMLAAFAVMLGAVSFGLTAFLYFSPDRPERRAPRPVAEVVKEPVAEPAPMPVAATQAEEPHPIAPEPFPLPALQPPAEQVALPAVAEQEESAAGNTAPPPETEPAPEPKPDVAKPRAARTARLILAVAPKGEIYIDGEHYGATPPLRTLNLEPGMHRVEIRSGKRKPYLTYVTLKAGDERRIRHDFAAKPSRPPR